MDETRSIEEINMEFTNDTTGEWEYVMIKNDGIHDGEDDELGDNQSNHSGEAGFDDDEILDMPPPWSPKLRVDKSKFVELCPRGEKTIFYKRCKVELFSDCK